MTAKPTTEQMREGFEAHILKERPTHLLERYSSECSPYIATPGEYTHSPTEARWRSWQAAYTAGLRDGLERAAEVNDTMRPAGGRAWDVSQHACYSALTDAAAAIRALKDKP